MPSWGSSGGAGLGAFGEALNGICFIGVGAGCAGVGSAFASNGTACTGGGGNPSGSEPAGGAFTPILSDTPGGGAFMLTELAHDFATGGSLSESSSSRGGNVASKARL